MEGAPAPKHPTTDRSDNVRDQVRNGIRLDGEWKYQRLCEGMPGCKPVRAGRFLIQSLAVFTSSLLIISSLLQLEGVARGLMYIHSQGMIHGDLKGVRFLYGWSHSRLHELFSFICKGQYTDR